MSEEELREYCKEASLEICNMQHTIDKQKEVLDKIKEIMEDDLSNIEKIIKINVLLEEIK